jgi:hypothetical protein
VLSYPDSRLLRYGSGSLSARLDIPAIVRRISLLDQK